MEEDEEAPEVEQKKHVTVKDEPEVFTIVPDSLEVERQERPKDLDLSPDPSSESLSLERLSNLVEETEDIIHICEEKVLNQKLTCAKLGFLLMRLAESVEEYENYVSFLTRFCVHGGEFTDKYFVHACVRLPAYGDYLRTLDAIADSKVTVSGIAGPVEKSDLKEVVKDIQHNTYSEGKFLGSFRVINKDVDKNTRERRQVIEYFNRQIKGWLKLKNSVIDHLDESRERLFRLSAYVQFFRSGDQRIKPVLDNPEGPDFEINFNSTLQSNPQPSKESNFKSIFHSTTPMLEDSIFSFGNSNLSTSFEDRLPTSGSTISIEDDIAPSMAPLRTRSSQNRSFSFESIFPSTTRFMTEELASISESSTYSTALEDSITSFECPEKIISGSRSVSTISRSPNRHSLEDRVTSSRNPIYTSSLENIN